jgi:hypothetical protein
MSYERPFTVLLHRLAVGKSSQAAQGNESDQGKVSEGRRNLHLWKDEAGRSRK